MINRELADVAFDVVMATQPKFLNRAQISRCEAELVAAFRLFRRMPSEVKTGYRDALLGLIRDDRPQSRLPEDLVNKVNKVLRIT